MWAKSVLLSAIFAASAFAAPVSAQQRHVQPVPSEWNTPIQYQRGGGSAQCTRSESDAIAEVASRAGGGSMVGRARCIEQGGRPIYEIRWRMPDDSLRNFYVSGS